jgi:F-type H+-transporting ATPase subunit b
MHIDWWTLAIQGVNVLILVWLLARFFYRPLIKIIEERRTASEGLLAAAKSAQATVDTEKAEIAATRAGIAGERNRLLAEALAQIAAERDAAGREAAAAAAQQRSESAQDAARVRQAMEASLTDKAAELAVEIARRLLSKRPMDSAPDLGLAAQLQAMPQRTLTLLSQAAGRQGGITIATAHPLDPEAQGKIRDQLEKILGSGADATLVVDPSLIAGFRLRSDALVLNDNWDDDLAQILKDLKSHDGRQ